MLGYTFGNVKIQTLSDQLGLIPIKLGQAKMTYQTYTIIHFHDLNPVIVQMNRLHLKTVNLTMTIDKAKDYKLYLKELHNSLALLQFIQQRVETNLNQVLPHPNRLKRGLINGIGSIFKGITGNLDASDGIRYDELIKKLQINQQNIQNSVISQGNVVVSAIQKFNKTVVQLYENDKLIEAKLNEVLPHVTEINNGRACVFLKEIINEMTHMYEIIDAILQEATNSLVFARTGMMHPSIISVKELYSELKNMEGKLSTKRIPIPITAENMPIFEEIIDIECFIVNNKIMYILHVPIVREEVFNYFHLYAIPMLANDQFKVVIPQNKFMVLSQLYFAHYDEKCKLMKPNLYLCNKNHVKLVSKDIPCEVRLLNEGEKLLACKQTRIEISKLVIEQMDETDKWIVVCPKETLIHTSCPGATTETKKLLGTYILDFPPGCQIDIDGKTINNILTTTKDHPQLMLFPDLAEGSETPSTTLNLSLHLPEIKLDELHQLSREMKHMQGIPPAHLWEISPLPSAWTILVYVILIGGCCLIGRKWVLQRRRTKQPQPTLREAIQLPA